MKQQIIITVEINGKKVAHHPTPYTPEYLKRELYIPKEAATVVGFKGLTDDASPTPEFVYTDDIAECGKYTVTEDENNYTVTSPLDTVFPFCDISEYTDASGNVFVKFPKMWLKWIYDDNGDIDGIKISDAQIDDGYFIPDAFLDPAGTGNYLDYFALGKYEATEAGQKLRSASGAPCRVRKTRADFRAAARAYGTAANAYNGYQQIDLSMLTLYNFLCMMYYKTPNIQAVFPGRTNESGAANTGSCDGIAGLNGSSKETKCVKMLGVENPYGNIFKWIDGVTFKRGKVLAQRLPTQYSDTEENGIPLGFSRPTSDGYVSRVRNGSKPETRSYVYPSECSEDGDANSGDYCYYDASGVVLCAGGSWSSTSYAGLWCLRGSNTASYASSNVGGRLAYRPL